MLVESAVAAADEATPVGTAARVLYSTTFEGHSLPADWEARGGWTVENALISPPEAGVARYAVWNRQTALENTVLEAHVQFLASDTQIALVRRDISRDITHAVVAGSLAVLDAAARQLGMYQAWDGTNQPGRLRSADIPFRVTTNTDYILRLWKTDAGHHGFGVWDPGTGERALVAMARSPQVDLGRQLDAPGFALLRGKARIQRMEFATLYPPAPRLMVFGDSNGEGEAIKPRFEKRFSNLAADVLGGDCAMASRAYESSLSLMSHLGQELDFLQPRYALVALGTNDRSLAEYVTGATQAVALLTARGITPILGTPPPNGSRPYIIDQIQRWIRASGVRYVDFAKVLSSDPDGDFWDPLYSADAFHANPLGARRMFDALKAAVPEVFTNAATFLRTVRIPSTRAQPGTRLSLPIELSARGNEERVCFSLAADAAMLSLVSVDPGPDFPPSARLLVDASMAGSNRLGVQVDLPPRGTLPQGDLRLLVVNAVAADSPLVPRTEIQFTDEPLTRHIVAPGLDRYVEPVISFPALDELAGYWRLDGDASDSSPTAIVGNALGASPVAGLVGGAFAFNGLGDHIELPRTVRAPRWDAVTLTVWAKLREVTSRQQLFAWTLADGGRLGLGVAEGAWEFGFGGRNLARGPVSADFADRWAHLAGVYDGAHSRLFVQGRLAAKVPCSLGSVRLESGALASDPDGTAGFFAGALDEARLYPRALSLTEIQALAGVRPGLAGTDEVWLEDEPPAAAIPESNGGDHWDWTSNAPPALSGSLAHLSSLNSGLHGHHFYFNDTRRGWLTATGMVLVAYVRTDPVHPPRMILVQWRDAAPTWDHRAFWGEALWPYGPDSFPACHYSGPLPEAGVWTRLEVPARWVGLEGQRITGVGVSLFDGAAAWDHFGAAVPAQEEVWLGEGLPPGAAIDEANCEPWVWTTNSPPPFAGRWTHRSPPGIGYRQHCFLLNGPGWPVGPADSLTCHVFLDPQDPPTMVMLQWGDDAGSWEHRAYWGENRFTFGVDGTASRRPMGPLPVSGAWVRLSVPAGFVGMANQTVSCIAFGVWGGQATWRAAGKARPGPASGPPPALALPEFLLDGTVLLRSRAQAKAHFSVLVSEDLRDWEWLPCLAAPGGPPMIIDERGGNLTRRFYRAAWPP
jgi:lysophospholipase L1-like esterase